MWVGTLAEDHKQDPLGWLDQLRAQLQNAPAMHRDSLEKEVKAIDRRIGQGQPADRKLTALQARVDQLRLRREQRMASRPTLNYDPALPVVEQRDTIARALVDHQVVIIAGETGSGKTTQLPKICLELGRGIDGLIGHTQPRRLAARTVAQRISSELRCELGSTVGYQVRFTDQVSNQSLLKLMTDGILLAEIARDPMLLAYDTLIVDEAHERSLNIDFLLGYLKRLLPRRSDMKLIITSATIDVARFSGHFNDAPIIEVSGRTYPVDTVYLEPDTASGGRPEQILAAVSDIEGGRYGERGDVLVFLPGERDIREAALHLRRHTELDVLPLYARLSRAEQDRVFDLKKRRGLRVVLATNVAETSLTVPGIRYVIDTGDARISRYSFRTKVQRLPIEPVSQASANQRKGRCGRVSEGVCLRLYSEDDFLSRPAFTDPEIRRTNLAAVILQMLRLKLGDIADFPFIDPPDSRMVKDGFRLLEELGAVAGGGLTRTGQQMGALPVDPRLARMLLAASELKCLGEMLIIASALSIQDPRERPADKQAQADQSHARFRHERSDFYSFLQLWTYFEEQRQALSQGQLRKLCQREFLNYLRMREWRDVHYQLTLACRQMKLGDLSVTETGDTLYEPIHRALLSGLLGNIAQFQEVREYQGARNRRLEIFPGSGQSKRRPRWLVAAELVETGKLYARVVAQIDPAWTLQTNPELLRHHYYDPRWQPRSGRVMATERIALFGLTVADKRNVHYGPIAPAESRTIFIREGLVAGRIKPLPDFVRCNQALVAELEALESRLRRRDLLADEQVLFEFYAERLPGDCYTQRHLQSWIKKNPEVDGQLRCPRDLLQLREPDADAEAAFPQNLQWEELSLPLTYQFEPGGDADGVSVTLPVALLNRAPRFLFQWLVPGLLREKCIAMLKSLPKSLRKHLVPAPDYADRALAGIQRVDEPLADALAVQLSRLGTVKVQGPDFNVAALDDYYAMNIRVVDERGALLAQGRDLDALVDRFREETRDALGTERDDSPARAGLTRWDLDSLPERWQFRQAGVDITSYPALVDRGDSVAVELLDYPEEAMLSSRRGVVRLLRQHNSQPVKYLRKQLLQGNRFSLALAGAGLQRKELVEDLIDASLLECATPGWRSPRDRTAFERLAREAGRDAVSRGVEFERVLGNTLDNLSLARQLLRDFNSVAWKSSREDMQDQVAALLAPGFLFDTPPQWRNQYPRYARALVQRLERLRGQQGKDEQHVAILQSLHVPFAEAQRRVPGLCLLCEPASRFRWMFEEFRVSLFAQALGTQLAVSAKRLEQQWLEVENWLRLESR